MNSDWGILLVRFIKLTKRELFQNLNENYYNYYDHHHHHHPHLRSSYYINNQHSLIGSSVSLHIYAIIQSPNHVVAAENASSHTNMVINTHILCDLGNFVPCLVGWFEHPRNCYSPGISTDNHP